MTPPTHIPAEWRTITGKYRHAVRDLDPAIAPPDPGVLTYFRDDNPVYVTATADLRSRVTADRDRTGNLAGSETRRLIARYHLGLERSIPGQPATIDDDALTAVNDYLDGCEVAWLRTGSVTEARELNLLLLITYRPLLNLDD